MEKFSLRKQELYSIFLRTVKGTARRVREYPQSNAVPFGLPTVVEVEILLQGWKNLFLNRSKVEPGDA
jgi:hypothetical protein